MSSTSGGQPQQIVDHLPINLIRRQQQLTGLSNELTALIRSDTEQVIGQFFLDTEIADSQLSMIFTCCHPDLKPEDQVALTLNTVSGFGMQEIARALVSGEAAIQNASTAQKSR